jgi:two-component sensor histidine kinase
MSIASVHKLLYESKNFTDISLIKLVKKLCNEIHNTYDSELLHVEFDIKSDVIFLNANQAVPFGLVLNELITNSYKHGFSNQKSAKFTIHFELKDGLIKFKYADSGNGFEGDYNQESLPQNSLGFLLIYNLSVQLSAVDFRIYADNGFHFNMDFQLVNDSLKGSTINSAFANELKELFQR